MSIWIIGKILKKQHYLKKKCYSNLNMEDITDADYMHGVCKDFQIKNVGEYHELYLKRDILLLAVFENFSKIRTFKLEPAKFLSSSW